MLHGGKTGMMPVLSRSCMGSAPQGKQRISQFVLLSREFFDCLGKGLEGVAPLRREGIDDGRRKKTRQRDGGTCSVFPNVTGRNREGGERATNRARKPVVELYRSPAKERGTGVMLCFCARQSVPLASARRRADFFILYILGGVHVTHSLLCQYSC